MEKPIIFSQEFIPLILAGKKTQTRRRKKINVNKGDTLWVKETFQPSPDGPIYRATEWEHGISQPDDEAVWTPSIHMPRWASRIELTITEEPYLGNIINLSGESLKKEGFPWIESSKNYDKFLEKWMKIYFPQYSIIDKIDRISEFKYFLKKYPHIGECWVYEFKLKE